MKTLKLLGLGLLVAVCGLFRAELASALKNVVNQDFQFNIPQGANGSGYDVNAKWSQPQVAGRDFTTSASNPADGKLLVKWICATSTAATAGMYVQILDTDRTDHAALGAVTGTWLGNFMAKRIGHEIDTDKPSCIQFERGIPIANGLVILNSDASIRSSVGYDVLRQ